MRQKLHGKSVTLLGASYPGKILGLHNLFRTRTEKRLIYKDINCCPGYVQGESAGMYVPARDKHIIYLRPGVDELTVAHELLHAILCSEGYVAARCLSADLRVEPTLGVLAGKVSDVLIHPVLLARLRRFGYALEAAERQRGAQLVQALRCWPPDSASRPAHSGDRRHLLRLFLTALTYVEGHFRFPEHRLQIRQGFAERSPQALQLGERLTGLAGWPAGRSPLQYRVRLARLIAYLDRVATDRGIELNLSSRILLPPFFASRRLLAPARDFFRCEAITEARQGGVEGEPYGYVLRFIPDGSCCACGRFRHRGRLQRIMARLGKHLEELDVQGFLRCLNLEYLAIEPRRRYSLKKVS